MEGRLQAEPVALSLNGRRTKPIFAYDLHFNVCNALFSSLNLADGFLLAFGALGEVLCSLPSPGSNGTSLPFLYLHFIL
jgi:hypothetical protein